VSVGAPLRPDRQGPSERHCNRRRDAAPSEMDVALERLTRKPASMGELLRAVEGVGDPRDLASAATVAPVGAIGALG
jgi:hypothetical protein